MKRPFKPRPARQNTIDKIWAKIDKSAGPDGCWPWMGYRMHYGHGRTVLNGKVQSVHRIIFEHATGKAIAQGMFVCHHCDNPPCCNPKHLFEGTPKDNTNDMMKKGRWNGCHLPPMYGTKNPAAKLDEDKVREIRRLHKCEKVTLVRLAQMYGVCRPTIISICGFHSWKNVV